MKARHRREFMWEWMDDTIASLDALDTWQKLLVGIGFSVLGAVMVRILIWTPSKWVVGKTDSDWDDDIMALAAPLLNYATFLLGLYITVIWAIDGSSMIASTMATIVVLILMFLTGKFLSKSASMVLPPALEKLDEKADLGLAGGTTIIIGLTKVFIWGSAVLLILAHLEVDITAALASLTIFSLVIGMAMQESASNFIISAQLMIDKPYEVGDKIQVDLLIGTVVDIGFLSTKIKTSSEHLVIVPNKTMATTVVTNYAKGGPTEAPRRVNLKIDVEVGYDESPPHVKTVIRNIIEENELVLSDPEPVILFTQMMPSGLIFRVNCWVGDYGDEWVARDQVQTAILRRFKEEDIEIPYPHMQLKYDTADDEEEARLKKADEKKAQEDKEKRQEEARRKDAKHQAKRAEERAVLRKHADELRVQLENEELEDEERDKIGTELMQIETRISGTDDD